MREWVLWKGVKDSYDRYIKWVSKHVTTDGLITVNSQRLNDDERLILIHHCSNMINTITHLTSYTWSGSICFVCCKSIVPHDVV